MNIVLLHLMMKFEDLRYLQLLLQQCKNKALDWKKDGNYSGRSDNFGAQFRRKTDQKILFTCYLTAIITQNETAYGPKKDISNTKTEEKNPVNSKTARYRNKNIHGRKKTYHA